MEAAPLLETQPVPLSPRQINNLLPSQTHLTSFCSYVQGLGDVIEVAVAGKCIVLQGRRNQWWGTGQQMQFAFTSFEQAVRRCCLALAEFGVQEHVCDGSEMVQSWEF